MTIRDDQGRRTTERIMREQIAASRAAARAHLDAAAALRALHSSQYQPDSHERRCYNEVIDQAEADELAYAREMTDDADDREALLESQIGVTR